MTTQYIDDSDEQVGARKYTGEVATGYDDKRGKSTKWLEENTIIMDFLADLPTGTQLLDCPVGTGRFIPYYESRRFQVLGVDISHEMLAEASKKITTAEQTLITLAEGDILGVPVDKFKKAFEVSMMIRLTRWISPEDCANALLNLTKVTKDRIIFTFRDDPNHPHTRPFEMWNEIIEMLPEPWESHRQAHLASDHNYWVAMLVPVNANPA